MGGEAAAGGGGAPRTVRVRPLEVMGTAPPSGRLGTCQIQQSSEAFKGPFLLFLPLLLMRLEMDGGNIISISYGVTMYIFNSKAEFFHKSCEKVPSKREEDEEDEGMNPAWRPH